MNDAPSPGKVSRLLRLALNVNDLARSASFYCEALGFAQEGSITASDPEQGALLGRPYQSLTMRLGEQRLELTAFDEPSAAYPADSRANDLWFQHFAIVTEDMEAATRRLQKYRPTPITLGGPQHLPALSGGVIACKFRDPDGHPFELLCFPSPHARPLPNRLTTGIDHTALSVGNADTSIAFYGHELGLSLTSQEINTGPRQERLDDLRGVKVQVIALTTTNPGPHIELLAYQQPRGRPWATAAKPTDLAASRTVLYVSHLSGLLTSFEHARLEVSENPRPTLLAVTQGKHAALVRDPDGHFLLLLQTEI